MMINIGYKSRILFEANDHELSLLVICFGKGHCAKSSCLKMIGIRLLASVQNSVSLKLMQRKTLNFVINLPDVENIIK